MPGALCASAAEAIRRKFFSLRRRHRRRRWCNVRITTEKKKQKKGLAPVQLFRYSLFHYLFRYLWSVQWSARIPLICNSIFCCLLFHFASAWRARAGAHARRRGIKICAFHWNNDCIINYVVCSRMLWLRLRTRLRCKCKILCCGIRLCLVWVCVSGRLCLWSLWN